MAVKKKEVSLDDVAGLIADGFEQIEKRFKLMEKRMAAFELRQNANGKKLDAHLADGKALAKRVSMLEKKVK